MNILDDLDFDINENDNEKSVEKDLKSILNSCIIDRNEVIERQPVAISAGHYKYRGKEYPLPLVSYGDFAAIVGASKSKKSILKSLLVGSYVGGDTPVNCCSNFLGHERKDKYVFDIDTEQSKYHSKRVFDRIDTMSGMQYENYIGISLRDKSAKERRELINYIVMESEYRNNIGLISIDGAADLVENFNDVTECASLADDFLTWTSVSKAALITVLHKNFGTSKPVGHLGSFILKKAETVLSVDVDEENKEYSNAVNTHSRNKSVPDFTFMLNEDFIPEIVEDY